MDVEQWDNVVIGSGEAGKYLAWTLARKGERTVVVERSLIGGACPNVACLPTKNVIRSARVASDVRRAAGFGVRVGQVSVDMGAVTARKQSMVDRLQEIHLGHFRTSGAEIARGEGRFVGERTIRVLPWGGNGGPERVLKGKRVFLDVGSRATMPAVPGLADARPMTHVEALELRRLPEHLIVLGGGYVGLEFAQAMRRFGSRVTVVQRGSRLLEREDAEVSDAIAELMRDEGVELALGSALAKVSGTSGEGVRVHLADGRSVEGTDLLVATGRTSNADSLDAHVGGVELDSRGYLKVNDRLETTAAGVWAMGDCAGSEPFTHVSFDDFRIVRDNLAGGSRSKAGRRVPYCLFTDPELAHVGLTEREAKEKGVTYRVAKIPMAQILRAHTLGEMRGFVKALVGEDDRIVGFTAFGAEASELLAAVHVAMVAGVKYQALRDMVIPHPTMAEGLTVLFAKAPA